MQITLLNEKAILVSLEAQARAQKDQLEAAYQDLKTLNRNSGKIGKLERGIAIQETNYSKYLGNLHAAHVDQVLEKESISNIRIVQEATYPVEPITRGKVKLAVLGLFFGIMGGFGLAFVAESMDHTLKNPGDVEEKLNLQPLAAIPKVRSNRLFIRERTTKNPDGQEDTVLECDVPVKVKKCYDAIRTWLLLFTNGYAEPPRMIVVTSCETGEGVSTVASNLAATLAGADEKPVVLVDANIAHPTIHRLLGLELSPGLAEQIGDKTSPESVIKSCPVDNLDIIPAGKRLTESCGIFDSSSFRLLVDHLKQNYGHIVFDAPSLKDSSAAMHLGSMGDGVILVAEAERSRWESVERARAELSKVKARVLGVVLNKRRFPIPELFYQRL
jgi:polysaccharide biosynthesis transport protein